MKEMGGTSSGQGGFKVLSLMNVLMIYDQEIGADDFVNYYIQKEQEYIDLSLDTTGVMIMTYHYCNAQLGLQT